MDGCGPEKDRVRARCGEEPAIIWEESVLAVTLQLSFPYRSVHGCVFIPVRSI